MNRIKYKHKEYFIKQAKLIKNYVKHGHTEIEYVDRFARLFYEHHYSNVLTDNKGVYNVR